jgi:hypothetical protein
MENLARLLLLRFVDEVDRVESEERESKRTSLSHLSVAPSVAIEEICSHD